MPMTPFMGVRISWLMFARNSPLARLAASAASLADVSSSEERRTDSAARFRASARRLISGVDESAARFAGS